MAGELNPAALMLLKNDNAFAEALVRQEAAQMYERESYLDLERRICKEDRDVKQAREITGPTSSNNVQCGLSSVANLYRGSQSSASPIERWMTVSAANEPMALYAKIAMRQTNVSFGSLDTVQIRSDAARALASSDLEVDDDDADEVMTEHSKKVERDFGYGANIGKPRVKRSVAARKRKDCVVAATESTDKRRKLS